MSGGSWKRVCQFGFLTYFIIFSYISVTTSTSLDLTELRNKVSKIKVNPRGNLWATGHFMGKKSVVDSSSLETPDEQALSTIQAALIRQQNTRDWREFVGQQMLKVAVQDHLQHTREETVSSELEMGLLMKILENYFRNSKK